MKCLDWFIKWIEILLVPVCEWTNNVVAEVLVIVVQAYFYAFFGILYIITWPIGKLFKVYDYPLIKKS